MRYLSADCIIPVSGEPVFGSILALQDDGTVEGIFTLNELKDVHAEITHYHGILCPGFVNTHCHLELSWVKGLIPEGGGLDAFLRTLEELRKSVSEASILKSIAVEALAMEQSGVVATADIVNGTHSLEVKRASNSFYYTLVEVFASDPAYADVVFERAVKLKKEFETHLPHELISIVPHSTYTLSKELFNLILAPINKGLLSIHHQESEDENAFFDDGSGPIADRRRKFNPGLTPFAGTGKRPIESITPYFNPDSRILLVHNTVTRQDDIDFVQRYFSQAYWCLCPNANLYIEKRLPDIQLFRANIQMVTLGTDSLASNRQLSILEEIKTIQKHFPDIPLAELIRWGTLNGASFLGQSRKLGSFEKGKSPGVVLIEHADPESLQLTPQSTSRLLIPALL